MPKMDGWEAIERIRANPMTAETLIVALKRVRPGRRTGSGPARGRLTLCLTKPCLLLAGGSRRAGDAAAAGCVAFVSA